ncbi:MAG TPA: hypothetical protein PLQ97_06965 [Myxococcota bacterium]|nr:hypothetical protein [Myxococcota bacterium]HQK51975.1 hypothetical protein [Myxococcota bacterium]
MRKRLWLVVWLAGCCGACGGVPGPSLEGMDLTLGDMSGADVPGDRGGTDGAWDPGPEDVTGSDRPGDALPQDRVEEADLGNADLPPADLSGDLPCPWDCDDGLPCTRDWCDVTAGQCRHEAIPGCIPCQDGRDCFDRDGCTRDFCRDGRCEWESIPIEGCVSCLVSGRCDDGNNCTLDRCVGEGYCVFECNCQSLCASDEDCRTGDLCSPGRCVTLRGTPGACSETVCVTGSPPSCDDGNACTQDLCDPATGGCLHRALEGCVSCRSGDACDDGDPCTDDRCDPDLGVCSHSQSSCDDQRSCTRDWCEAGTGCRHDALPGFCERDEECRDEDPCTDDRCDPDQGCCRFDLRPGCRTCRDDADCEDHDPCTEDLCDRSTGTCRAVWTSVACDDGEVCTVGDRCHLGLCESGAWNDCDDRDPCTDDSCLPGRGCIQVANEAPCDDGDPCTEGDRCAEGGCRPGTPVVCNDGNPCTADACEGPWGCVFSPVEGPCNDNDACTEGDRCVRGACQPGAPVVCDDHNPCTDDSCDPARGCRFVANTLLCDDGNACTVGDQCLQGNCRAGSPASCDDQVLCTVDGCEPASGCWHRLDLRDCNCLGKDANCLLSGERTCCRLVDVGGGNGIWRCRVGNDCL